jgi:D-glycerate 3-kinase
MTLAEMLSELGLEDRLQEAGRLLLCLPVEAPLDWQQLAVVLAMRLVDQREEPRVLGIGGGQGAGKSTLARLLELALSKLGLRVANLSLDDFYLTSAERQALAHDVHPLLATRGVPGTHDVAMACRVIKGLTNGADQYCPSFDKARDDRLEETKLVTGPIDVVIFEGWCVGAAPVEEQQLTPALNDLERNEDAHGRWRQFVNEQLKSRYLPLWEQIDDLLYLQVPGIDAVLRWRGEQEQQHDAAERMNPTELLRFVSHYERITMSMRAAQGATADMVGVLDERHRLADFTCRNPHR